MSGPRAGIPALDRGALEAARIALLERATARGWIMSLSPRDAEDVTRAALKAYLLGRRTRMQRKTRPYVLQMAAMEVGDVLHLGSEGMTTTGWRGRIRSARNHAGNPDMCFSVQTVTGEFSLRVERLPDGLPPARGRGRSEQARALAELKPGETRTFDWPLIDNNDRRSARAILNEPGAYWRSRRTNQGLRVERVR